VVNLIEADPHRRVKLNISHKRLADLHPADLADIVEELSHQERQAIFTALDDVTAAEALSEVDPQMQVSIVESLDPSRAADIVEEMPQDAAADLLGDLSEETSSEVMNELDQQDAAEIGELMEFHESSAGGLMSTDYVAIPSTADVHAARYVIGGIPDLPENFNTIFLVDDGGKYVGSVPLSKLVVAAGSEKLTDLKSEPLLSVPSAAPEDEVVGIIDKYNLLTLPVVDEEGVLIGVVTVDDVVSLLRKKA
jgi:Mg/Co/Ni transporter MgtE